MDDIGAAVSSFLSKPGAMEQLETVAKQLGLGEGQNASSQKEQGGEPSDGPAPEQLRRLMTALQSSQGEAPALLEALMPLLRPEKGEKLQKAAKALRLMRTAKAVAGTVEL